MPFRQTLLNRNIFTLAVSIVNCLCYISQPTPHTISYSCKFGGNGSIYRFTSAIAPPSVEIHFSVQPFCHLKNPRYSHESFVEIWVLGFHQNLLARENYGKFSLNIFLLSKQTKNAYDQKRLDCEQFLFCSKIVETNISKWLRLPVPKACSAFSFII